MIRTRRRLTAVVVALAALGAAGATGPARAIPPGSTAAGDAPDAADSHAGTVTARLLSDVASIAAGSSFVLAIEMTMAPGWHTYWENGGDAGLPTSVDWKLPMGFSAGPLLFPVPHRYQDEGDLVTFGYADRVILLTDVRAPKELMPGETVQIQGAVSWLQCKDICIPGQADVSIRLPVEAASRPAPAPVRDQIAAVRAQLPRPASSLERVALHSFQSEDAIPAGGKGQVAVVFEGLAGFDPKASVFFPRNRDGLLFRDGEFRTDGKNLALVVPVTLDASVPAGSNALVPGVVEIARAGGGAPWLLSLELPLSVASAGAVPHPTNAPVFAPGSGPFLTEEALAAAPAAASAQAAERGHLLRYLLLAFLGGIILNVMPCVLPVVSLKVLGFVSKAQEHRSKVAKLGLTFGAGVLASFLALATIVIVVQAAGERLGWGFQFQNPVFVAALAVIVFVFSLSLLGVFEIGGITAMLGMGFAAAERKDYADAFFHGVLTTVLATPCTAPMLGTAIGFAFSQPPYVILLIFVAVAVGLAAPYVLLSMNPGWLKYVPKPGVWMDRFKQAMGFLLLATLVWLLAVLGAQIGLNGVIRMTGFLLVVAVLCWVHGTFLDLSSSGRRVATVWALTIAGLVVGYVQLLHAPLFSPENDGAAGAASSPSAARPRPAASPGGPTPQALADAVADGRTVFLDLTADWCWTCKVNERTVLKDGEVEAAFRTNSVVTLKGDWTRRDPEITDILRRHNRAGVPFYAVYPAGHLDSPIVLPEIINKKIVLESLAKAGPSRTGA